MNSATDTLKKSIKLGGEVETLKKSFEAMAKDVGASGLTLEKLREATKGTVSDVDLLTAANQALALGLPTDNLDQLFESAMKLGHAMGIDTKAAVESLTTGIGRQSKQILDNLGVVFQANDAYEWYAQKIGVAADQLTEAQKKQAWMAYAIEQVTERAKALGDNISETQLRQEQWNATITNMTTSLGKFLQPLSGISPVMDEIMQAGGPLIGTMLPDLIKNIGNMGGAAKGAMGILGKMASFMTTGPWGLAIAGAIGAGALLYTAWTEDWGGIRTFVTEKVLPAISDAISGFVDTAKNVWDRFCDFLSAIKEVVLDPLVGWFTEGFQKLTDIFTGFKDFVTGWIDKIREALKPITDFFGGLINSVQDALSDWTETHQDMLNNAEELEQQLVGGSVWTDMLKEMKKQTKSYLSQIDKLWYRGMKSIGKSAIKGINVSLRTVRVALAAPTPTLSAGAARAAPSVTTTIGPINAPLVNVEGSMDLQTAEVVTQLVKESLETVVIEPSSAGAPTKRIRVPTISTTRMTLLR